MPDLRKLIHIYLLTLTKLNRNGSKMDSQGAFQLGLGRIELIAERSTQSERWAEKGRKTGNDRGRKVKTALGTN